MENAIGCGVQSITAAVYRRVADPSAASAAPASHPYTRDDARTGCHPVNTEYLLWFAGLVVVAGAALLWLAIGDVPDIPTDPGADDPDRIGAAVPLEAAAVPLIGPAMPLEPELPPRRRGAGSDPAGEDGLARFA